MGSCTDQRGARTWEATSETQVMPGEGDDQEEIPATVSCRERTSVYEGRS